MAKVVYISELDFHGSGYSHITIGLCTGLARRGHDVKVLAFTYKGEEHEFPFSVIPVDNPQEIVASLHNLVYVWKPDVIVVALDIPFQERFIQHFAQYNIPYIAITPLESDPLTMSWAMTLMQARKTFFISEFGAEEARKVGIEADHLQIGVDTESWRMPSPEERKMIRKSLFGIENDTFIILTVADNQERKNLSAAMKIISRFKKEITEDFRYVLVTRQNLQIGWKLTDMATEYEIFDKTIIFDRMRQDGISFKELWSIYASADCLLLPSKGEGLGMPVLEAMSVGVPVVGTDAGAITEHIQRGGGWLIKPEYVHRDPYGNENRYYAGIDSGLDCLVCVHNGMDVKGTIQRAREYVESRTWDIPSDQLSEAINEVVSEQTKQEQEISTT